MTVTSMREGATADSKTPSSTLVVTRPAQFFAADVQTTMMPHYVRMLANILVVYRSRRTYESDHRSKVLGRRKRLHAVCMREFAGQVRNIEDHRQLTELIAYRSECGS
jgi:siroheme synthase (precorrin-2 oxidase/ferrochelatase)